MDHILDANFWTGLRKRLFVLMCGHVDSEDTLRSAFIRLEDYRTRQTIDSPAGFQMRTALILGVDHHHRDHHHTKEGIYAEIFDNTPLRNEVIAARERLHRVEQGMARLSPRTREVFLMYRIDGSRYREIAARLGISENAVANHIAEAALFLTDWMER